MYLFPPVCTPPAKVVTVWVRVFLSRIEVYIIKDYVYARRIGGGIGVDINTVLPMYVRVRARVDITTSEFS